MSHFGTIHSLEDGPLPGIYSTHPTPVTFEFDNFGVSHQRVAAAEALAASAELESSTADASEQSGHIVHRDSVNNYLDNREVCVQSDSAIAQSNSSVSVEEVREEQSDVHGEKTQTAASEIAEAPVIDIAINNVVCSFSTRCHLNLKKIAMEGMNAILKKESGMVSMKLRKPYTTASIWSSGKITCTGATSEEDSKKAARRFARIIQKIGFKTKVANFRIVNVLGTCSLPFAIKITALSRDYPREASYEPELHPGVTYRLKQPKATLKIFSTGSITVTAPRVANIQAAIEHIFPIVFNYRMDKGEVDSSQFSGAQMSTMPACCKKRERSEWQKRLIRKRQRFDESDEEDWTDTDDDDDDDDIDSDIDY